MLSKGKGFMGVFQGHFTYVLHQERPYRGTSPEYTFLGDFLMLIIVQKQLKSYFS